MIRIAIDGPSGAGKSTMAKLLAKDLGIDYIDTGAMYKPILPGDASWCSLRLLHFDVVEGDVLSRLCFLYNNCRQRIQEYTCTLSLVLF